MDKVFEFFKFLKENGALEKYITNVPDIRTVKSLLFPKQYISGLFIWDGSEDGYDYWNQLHDKWIKYLDSLNS